MILIVIIVLLHLFAALLVSIYFWRPENLSDFPAFTLITAFTTFYAFPIIIGWASGYINIFTILISAFIALAIGILCRVKNKMAGINFQVFIETIKKMKLSEKLLWIIILCLILFLIFIGSRLPIRTWDAAAYHSLNPMRWAETHRFIIDSYGDPKINSYIAQGEVFPNVKGILPYIIIDLTGSENGTGIAQFPYILLLISCLISIYRRLNLSGYLTPLGILFCLSAPEIILQSVEAYADAAFFAGQMSVLFICLIIFQEKASFKKILLGSLCFAILSGTKPTALLMGGVLGVLYLIIIFFKTDRAKKRVRYYLTGFALLTAIIISLIIAGPWYVNGIKKFSNPVYPFRLSVGSKIIFEGPYSSDSTKDMVKNRQGAEGFKGWWMMMNETERLPLISSWKGGLGANALILGIPATLLLFLFLFFGDNRKNYLVVILLFGAMTIATPVLLWARFSLYQLALFALAFGWILSKSVFIPRVILIMFFIFLSSYNIVRTIPAILYRTYPPEYVFFNLISGNTRGIQTSSFPDQFNALDFWREHVADTNSILALPKTHPYFARPLNKEAKIIRVLPRENFSSVKDWMESLKKIGATHLYAPKGSQDFSSALENPEYFQVLFQRIDSASETPLDTLIREESALFKIFYKQGDDIK